ncbi:thioredoxin family protein [Kiloniella sp. b19]|uniref:thioredoxin family protein n=1 Tax=Kiloniella sp. GXU_MW_B19 TaxID=3141326 RepID=UPI0031D37629
MLLNTPICDFGWQAPGFSLKDPRGKVFTLEESLGDRGLLIAFICNHCPYVQAIGERLASDTRELMAEGVNVLAIMANDYDIVPEDSPEQMLAFARHFGFEFPYLIDEDQSVAKSYGAVCTPDFFGFNKDGELQYRGRLDDARMGQFTDRNRELVDAMMQIAETGHGPEQQIASMGCSIKWRGEAFC